MGSRGKSGGRAARPARNRRRARDFDSEFDLVQNNGRVTLPGLDPGSHLNGKYVAIFVLLGFSLLIGALIGRK
jgi:hypothetical protein